MRNGMRMQTGLLLATLALLAVTLVACGSTEGDTTPTEIAQPPLAGTSWILSSVNGQDALQDSIVTALFGESDTLTGFGGCNLYTASYVVEGNRISIETGVATRMDCPEAVRIQEEAVFSVIISAGTYEIEGGTLTLSNADGTKVGVFSAVQAIPIEGTSWTVSSYNDGQGATVSLLPGTEITAQFGEDGTLTGSAGCNSYSGSYQADGEAISIGPTAATEMACLEPEGVMDQELAYLAALAKAEIYRSSGIMLGLFDAEGTPVVIYIRSEP